MDKVKLFCSKDCPDTCSFYAAIDNNEILHINPNKEQFLEKGFVCKKLKKFYSREVLNNKTKSFYIDKGQKKEKDVLFRLSAFLKKNKEKKILLFRGSGSLGYYMGFWDKLFSNFKNCYFVEGNPCDETGIIAHIEDFGICTNPPIENLENTDTIILFGRNAYVTSPHLFVYLQKLKKSIKKIIYIDPIKSKTAEFADKFIQINPATDGLLAYSLCAEMGYVEKKHNLLNEIGISKEEFEFLFDSIKPNQTGIIEGAGLQRYSNGKNSIRWINRLAYYTHNLNNLFYSRSSKEGIEKIKTDKKHTLSIADITNYLDSDFFDIIIVVASNPVVTMPQNSIWKKALKKATTVVIDTNETETSKYAGFFIRVGGMFAQDDIQGSYFFRKTLLRERLIKNITSDTDAIKRLSHLLGFDITIPKPEQIKHKKISYKRIFTNKEIEIKKPLVENGKIRLITLSSSDYLNSQVEISDLETIFISKETADKLHIKENDKVLVKNNLGIFKAVCKITDKIKGNNAYAFKNRSIAVNSLTKNLKTDAEYGLSYYDLFVEIIPQTKKGALKLP